MNASTINSGGHGTADVARSDLSLVPATAQARLRMGTGVGFGVPPLRRTGEEQLM